MTKWRFDSRFPEFWLHAHPPPLPKWCLSQKFPRPPWRWRDLSVSQLHPNSYAGFSELCVIASGRRSCGICRWATLMTQPWGQATGTALPWALLAWWGRAGQVCVLLFPDMPLENRIFIGHLVTGTECEQKGPWFNISRDRQPVLYG